MTGWTRIFNRVDRTYAFNRSINDFIEGFGDLNKNHWPWPMVIEHAYRKYFKFSNESSHRGVE